MKRILLLLTIVCFSLSGINAQAGSLVVPNTFSSGSPAYAASVNDNFTAVETEVTNNAGDIAANAASITQNRADIATNTANLTNHTHSAGDITSGTLSNGRFSAYGDLGAEGYLDNNAGTDLLTRTQADTRYSGSGHIHTAISTNITNISNNAAMITSLQNAHTGTRTGYFDVNSGTCVPTVGSATTSLISPMFISTSDTNGENFACHVNIPNGAVVVEVSVDWDDNDANPNREGEFSLVKTLVGSTTPSFMATVFSSGSAGFATYSKTTIASPTMDLVNNTYGIILTLTSNNVSFRRALIRYEYNLD